MIFESRFKKQVAIFNMKMASLKFSLENKFDIKDLRHSDLQPYGKFITGIPKLLPPHTSDGLWIILEYITYISKDGIIIEIEQGKKTDLASTPGIAKLIFGGPGLETPGAIVHDEGYEDCHEERVHLSFDLAIPNWKVIPEREWWDNVFWDIMSMFKTNKAKKNTYWFFVRTFGLFCWKGK